MSVVEPGWMPDPTGRHEFRWWDGTAWSALVSDQGVETIDQLDVHRPAAPPGGGVVDGGRRSADRESNRRLALVAGVGVLALVVVGIVAVTTNRGGGSDETGGAAGAADPRQALISSEDLPAGWQQAESPPGEAENVICEPGIEPADPPREAKVYFDRPGSPDWLTHVIVEYSPQFASDNLDEHERQAGQCGTFEDVNEVNGETWRDTITPEVLTGPTLGDETLWYVLHIDNQVPNGESYDLLTCLDRHDGVISAVRVSTRQPVSDADRTLVENLARTASERLES